jgi:hypothetical protein
MMDTTPLWLGALTTEYLPKCGEKIVTGAARGREFDHEVALR